MMMRLNSKNETPSNMNFAKFTFAVEQLLSDEGQKGNLDGTGITPEEIHTVSFIMLPTKNGYDYAFKSPQLAEKIPQAVLQKIEELWKNNQ